MATEVSPHTRDRVTSVAAGAYVLIGAANAAIGPVSEELRDTLHLSSVVTGMHGAMFGWFLLACGLLSAWILRVVDVGVLLRAGVVATGAGLMIIAIGRPVAVTLAGAVVLGAGGAVMVLVVPQIISAHHGPDSRAGAFTYINALSQMGSIGAPLLLALTLHQGWGWRTPLAVVGATGVAVVGLAALRTALPHHGADADGGPGRTGAVTHLRRLPEARLRWFVLTLGISVEFATLFWASASVQDLAGASASAGAVGVGLFAGGMVVGRLAGPSLLPHIRDVTVLRASFLVAGLGAVVLRAGPGVVARLVALAVAGLGLALVYPVAFSRLYGVGVPDGDVAAVGALASGTAVTFSPLALGALADATSLGWALLIVPAMALVGLLAVRDRAATGPSDR